MSDFVVKIETDGAAFEDEFVAFEIADMLRDLADKVQDGMTEVYLRDNNGNTVGHAEFREDK